MELMKDKAKSEDKKEKALDKSEQKYWKFESLAHLLIQGKSAKQIETETQGTWNRRKINRALKNLQFQRILQEEQALYYNMIRQKWATVMEKAAEVLLECLDPTEIFQTRFRALKIVLGVMEKINITSLINSDQEFSYYNKTLHEEKGGEEIEICVEETDEKGRGC